MTPMATIRDATSVPTEFPEAEVTGADTPEEVIETLNEYGVSWHLTQGGELWIRGWKVAAEEFIRPEDVPALRAENPREHETDDLDWVSRNLDQLREDYGGEWIAVVDGVVVGANPLLPGLVAQLNEQDVVDPFITQVPAGDVVWETAYAG